MSDRDREAAREITGDCTCSIEYKSRNRKDPSCCNCDCIEVIAQALATAREEGRREATEGLRLALECTDAEWKRSEAARKRLRDKCVDLMNRLGMEQAKHQRLREAAEKADNCLQFHFPSHPATKSLRAALQQGNDVGGEG